MSISSIRINNRVASTLQVGNVIAQSAYYGQSLVFTTFDLATLFNNGEQGAWYDPSDLSTLFQDDAGTTPVTEPGQTVGLMLDKSGNDNHATQPTPESRPVYQAGGGLHWLELDGVDDALLTNDIDFTGSVSQSYIAGVEKEGVARGTIASLRMSDSTNAFQLEAPSSNNENYGLVASGDSGFELIQTLSGTYPAPSKNILFAQAEYNNDTLSIRIDGEDLVSGFIPSSSESWGVQPLAIGYRVGQGDRIFQGKIYSLILRSADFTEEERNSVEIFVTQRSGVTL